ncbi:hypothetical protein [Pseudomonas viridiflava]|uniref:hypothetical protein n=1 Tax=Pseudomonas viridiflava TaxID=33069 RepID=UPI000F0107EF|nr:hypothetical protein [Pseudomonas viridiflava]
MIVPLLRVGMQPVTLCVTALDAERPDRRYHAERGNDPFKHVALFEDAQRPGAIDINPFDNLSIQRNAP